MDNKLPVLLLWVLHGVKGLLGDAVQVHIPPVLQHLKGDVGTVYHSPRCLWPDKTTILPTHVHTPLSLPVFIWILLKKTFRSWYSPGIDGLMTFAALESEKISWTLATKERGEKRSTKASVTTQKCRNHPLTGFKPWTWGGDFTLTFKFDISQVFRKVVKCYFQPLIKLFGKFTNNLSQTVDEGNTNTKNKRRLTVFGRDNINKLHNVQYTSYQLF